MRSSNRRQFLKRAMGGAAAAVAAPSWLRAESLGEPGPFRPPAEPRPYPPLPSPPSGDPVENEPFWELVKEQFPLTPGFIVMNAANLCPSPYPVQEAVFRLTRDVDGDASFQNRGKFGELRETSREALAALLGASTDEIAITRNTSESNSTVVSGLDLGPGDEVVIWEQNHPTNNVAWDVRAERRGFTVRRVATPRAPSTAEELIAPFDEAITANTRVLAFSHISNISGLALPAAELCRLAGERGILTLIDGAQSFGAIRVDLHAIGCDFYTGSAHKWLTGPKEAGVLYVREESIPALWPHIVGSGWEGRRDRGARKFEVLGQRDDAAVSAVATAVAFQERIGPDLIEERIRYLETSIREAMRTRIPGVAFHTSEAPERRAGVVVLEFPDIDHRALFGRLYEEYRIGGAARGGDFPGLRLCPHIYNTLADVERVADAIAAEALRSG